MLGFKMVSFDGRFRSEIGWLSWLKALGYGGRLGRVLRFEKAELFVLEARRLDLVLSGLLIIDFFTVGGARFVQEAEILILIQGASAVPGEVVWVLRSGGTVLLREATRRCLVLEIRPRRLVRWREGFWIYHK